MTYSYDRTAARKPVPYKEGDHIEVRIGRYPEIVQVEDRIQIRGEPGFMGHKVDDGTKVTGLDEQVIRLRKKETPRPPDVEHNLSEVLTMRVKGKVVHVEIGKFLRNLYARANEAASLLQAAAKEYERLYGEKVDSRELERVIFKGAVEPHFGDDKLARILAHALTTGKYLW